MIKSLAVELTVVLPGESMPARVNGVDEVPDETASFMAFDIVW